MNLPLNQIICGNCVEVMREWPKESVDFVMFSPPYWGLRCYGEETVTVWGGEPSCEHKWSIERTPRPNQAGGTDEKRAIKGKLNYSEAVDYHDRASYSSFCVKCGAWRGQLGLEPHPQMYIDHLVEVCREVKRVLKKTGNFYLNLGDTFYGGRGYNDYREKRNFRTKINYEFRRNILTKPLSNWLQPKQKMLIPYRVAIALQEDGWLCRGDIIWHKPNAMPSSVKDRLNVTHEVIFHFVKSRKYYYCLDNIREPHKSNSKGLEALKEYCLKEYERRTMKRVPYDHKISLETPDSFRSASEWNRGTRETMNEIINSLNVPEQVKSKLRTWWHDTQGHPKGKNPGDIIIPKSWGVNKHGEYHGKATKDYKSAGAQNPSEVKRRIIESFKKRPKGKNPGDILSIQEIKERIGDAHKGEATAGLYRPHKTRHELGKNPGDFWSISTRPFKGAHFAVYPPDIVLRPILSSCPPDGVVVDPMCGSGTTMVVAEMINRRMWDEFRLPVNDIARKVKWNLKWIGIELNSSYVEIAKQRLSRFPKTILEFAKTP